MHVSMPENYRWIIWTLQSKMYTGGKRHQYCSCVSHYVLFETLLLHNILTINRQLYHWWGYFSFIFNTFGGLWSSLKRSLLSVAIVMVLLIRMDRNIYIREYETCDQGNEQVYSLPLHKWECNLTPNAGYSAYIAALYLEFTQNNPIVNCFVQILLEVCADKNSCDKPVKLIRAAHPGTYLSFNTFVIMFMFLIA